MVPPSSSRKGKERERSTFDDSVVMANMVLRLSYAALKVDNGWTTLTLDEVENLYFRTFRSQALEREQAKQAQALERRGNGEGGSDLVDREKRSGGGLDFPPMNVDVQAPKRRRSDAGLALPWSYQRDGDPPKPAVYGSGGVLGKRKANDTSSPTDDSRSRSTRPRPASNHSPSSGAIPSDLSFLSPTAPGSMTSATSTSARTLQHLTSPGRPSGAPVNYADFWQKMGSPGGVAVGSTPLRSAAAVAAGRATTPSLRSPSTITSPDNAGPNITLSSTLSPSRGRNRNSPFHLHTKDHNRTLTGEASHSSFVDNGHPPSSSQHTLSASQPSNGGSASNPSSQSTATSSSKSVGRPLGSQASFSILDPAPPLDIGNDLGPGPDRFSSLNGGDEDDDDEEEGVFSSPRHHGAPPSSSQRSLAPESSQAVDDSFPPLSQVYEDLDNAFG